MVDKAKRPDAYKGYRGKALEFLKSYDITVWSEVRILTADGTELDGIVLPRAEGTDDKHIVLKLRNGYNMGVS
ncbi:MAG: hypothetical protein DRH44_02605, partial [Candidatus Coatesbacteria bacterium]